MCTYKAIAEPRQSTIFETHSGVCDNAESALQSALRRQYHDWDIVATLTSNVDLLRFARAGHASAKLDVEKEVSQAFRYFHPGDRYSGRPDQLVDARTFARYDYHWNDQDFIVYVITISRRGVQYILKKQTISRSIHNIQIDELITAVGQWQLPKDGHTMHIYDGGRGKGQLNGGTALADLILSEAQKQDLVPVARHFFASEDLHSALGASWRRRLLLHGSSGTGKTAVVQAIIDSVLKDLDDVQVLCVRHAIGHHDIHKIFRQARAMSPCLLVLDNIETMFTPWSLKHFLHESDAQNNGILILATVTSEDNNLSNIMPGINRFDRIYAFSRPSEADRQSFAQQWRRRLGSAIPIRLPQSFDAAFARETEGFNYVSLKEVILAAAMSIAHEDGKLNGYSGDHEQALEDIQVWKAVQKEIQTLRHMPEMQSHPSAERMNGDSGSVAQSFQESPFREVSHIEGSATSDANKTQYLSNGDDYLDTDFQHAPLITDDGWFLGCHACAH